MDMPRDPAKAAAYWEKMLTSIEKKIFVEASTVVVARVVRADAPDSGNNSGMITFSAKLTPVKPLRGPASAVRVGRVNYHWCADYKPSVVAGRVYLLAMTGTEIHGAVPLDEGKERADVAAFFKRIAEPDPWRQ
jgi:hypothetical protein